MDFFESFVVFYIIVITLILVLILEPFIKSKFSLFLNILKKIDRKIKERRMEKKIKHTIENIISPHKTKSINDVILIAVVYLFIGYLILAKFLFFAVVVSNSMYPTVEKGDLILIQTISREPEVGDIILFRGIPEVDPERRELILHRVYDIEGDKIYTKGDAMPMPDPWVITKDDIVGKAVTIAGYPIVVRGAGEDLVLEPGKTITNPIAVHYILGTMRKFGFLIFILIVVFYILLEVLSYTKRRSTA